LWIAAALTPWKARVVAIPIAAAAAIVALAAIFSDAFGTLRPDPRATVSLSPDPPGAGVVRITNSGGRPARLLARPADSLDGFRFLVERRVGPSSFAPAGGRGPLFESSAPADNGQLFEVGAGGVHEIPFVLDSGEYRVSLEPRAPARPIEILFRVEGVPPPPAPVTPAAEPSQLPGAGAAIDPSAQQVPADTPESAALEPAPQTEAVPAQDESGPEVELNGILTTPGEAPLFTLDVRYPDGVDQRVSLGLGAPVWGDWVIEEFNPDELTITLIGQGRFLILRRGAPVQLTQ
jgi:hypothetical protein